MLKDFNSKTVGIFGAGFVGENVIKKLAKSGHRIKIASRNPYLKQDDLISVKNSFFGKSAEIIREVTAPFIGIYSTKEILNF